MNLLVKPLIVSIVAGAASLGALDPAATTRPLFPLTPALSLGERGTHQSVARTIQTSRFVEARPAVLPLPKGEGRGEGKGDVQQPLGPSRFRSRRILCGGSGDPSASHRAPDAPALAGAAAAKDADLKPFTAVLYAKDGAEKKPLFNLKRTATRSGSTLNVLREYTYPDGQPALRERVVYENGELVSAKLEELQIDARGSATIRRQPGKPVILFEYLTAASAGGKPKTDTETLRNDTVVDDLVGPFIAAHWDALSKGQPAKCRYLSIPRRETVGFTFTQDSQSVWQGQPVVIIKMEATSPIIAALVDPMFFTVEKGGEHRVLRYVGRTGPKLKVGNKWTDLDVVTIFKW